MKGEAMMLAERMDRFGAEALRDFELLALALRCDPAKVEQVDVREMMRDGAAAMVKRYGIGPAKAQSLAAARELVRRCDARPAEAPSVSSARQVWELLSDLRGKNKEYFVALYLTARNRLIQRETVSIGTLTASLVHPRETFGPALERAAAGVIIAHNHPSGEISPSPEDKSVTRRLDQAGKLLGVPLLDHVIVGDQKYFSFREAGLL